jgi:pimeloyl-ACP methyl ester carboxylesterase
MPVRKFGIILLFLGIFSLYSSSCPGLVFADWFTKYSGNPVLEGTAGGWDSRDTLCTSVIYENNKYNVWYTGNNGSGWRIGFASSTYGMQSWEKESLPIIDIGSSPIWEKEVANPSVIKDGEIYKMWYTSIGPHILDGDDRFRIRYATSSNKIDWNEKSWVLKATPNKWDRGGMDRGLSVLKSPSGYYQLWYAGVNEKKMGTSEEKWQIGYATSPDGINWTKYPSNEDPQPVISPTESWELNSVSYPHVIYENGVYHMWYAATDLNLPIQIVYAYSLDGINWIKPEDKNPVLKKGSDGAWDDVYVGSPFVIKIGENHYRMYYDGYDGSRWRIGIAEFIGNLPTPILTPTPTSSPSPTSSPTPTPLPPLVFLPGLGSSWNFENLFLGIEKPPSEWKLLPGPGERVYNSLLQTFKNAGYQDSTPQKNLFLFTYNWTKPVSQITEDLKSFIQTTVQPKPDQKIILVGHSLGGLTSRTYVQNNPENPVGKLLTLGSPHQGAVQVYYAWEGGDLRFMNILERIAVGLLLNFRRQGFATDKETVRAIAPVLKDLLPTFNYLKQNGSEIPYQTMKEKNNWLIDLNTDLSSPLFTNFTTLLSNIPQSTPRWINVRPRNWLDEVLNLWPDGKPLGEAILDTGDKTVLSLSAQINGARVVELSGLNHREIIQTQAGQEKIMEILDLHPTAISTSEDISEPVLVFLIASPATIEIFDSQGNPVGEGDERLKIITAAAAGNYQIKITGTGNGSYHLYVGQLTQAGDFWSEISGQITRGENQLRQINFQPTSPSENPFLDENGAIFNQSAQQKIKELKEYISNKVPSPKIKILLLNKTDSVLHQLKNGKIQQAISSLYELHFSVSRLQKQQKLPSDLTQNLKNQIEKIIADLEQVYIKTNPSPYPPKKLREEIRSAENFFRKMEEKLKNLQSQNKATASDGALYLLAQEKLTKTKSENSQEAHIYALGVRYLSLEGLVLFK